MGKINTKDATGRTTNLTRVRLSFADSLKEASLPKKNRDPNAVPTHSVNLILERDSKDFDSNKAAIISALKAAAREGKQREDLWEDFWENDPKQLSFRKGERFKADSGEVYKGYEGNLIVVGKGPMGGKKRPNTLLDRHKRPVEVEDINDVCYNGSYCDAIISWYFTENGGTKRLTCSVEAIRSHQEGERLGGGGVYVEADDFDDLEGDDGFDDTPPPAASSSSSSSSGAGMLDI